MREPHPPGDRSPSESSPTNRQVPAVLAWLVVEVDVPKDVHLHLVEAMWWRLDAQAAAARADSVVLDEVRDRISLAMQALRDEHPPALGQPVPRSPGG